jgi:hypothetical protein
MSETSVVGLAKIGNAAMRRSELDRSGAPGPALRYFNQQMLIHELIRGSLVLKVKYQWSVSVCDFFETIQYAVTIAIEKNSNTVQTALISGVRPRRIME